MSGLYDNLGRMWLRGTNNVARAIAIECPVCHEKPGTACRVVSGIDKRGNKIEVAEVHDQRESTAFHRPKLAV